MKERVYGWYPAAHDIYISNREPQSYEKECLYRHWKSTYSHRPGSKNSDTPGTPTSVKINLSPRPQRRSASPSRASSLGGGACRPHTVSATPHTTQEPQHSRAVDSRADSRIFTPDEHRPATEGARTRPASFHVRYKTPTSATPKKAWSMKVPETPVTFVPRPPSAKCSLPPGHECDNLNIRTPDAKPDRVRSATYERPRSTLPPRPVKSAGTARSPYTSYSHDQGSERPRAPVPSSSYPYEDSTLDYDEQLEKHGWRMEVPGDPLNLKRPCIAKRLPVTYKVKIPIVPPNPPRAKATNYETFFYNTIPRKPMSFTIHQEWVSEVLHAKRMELQKREGYRYKTNDFGFVY